MVAKKTHETFTAEMAHTNPNIAILGKYEGANTKIALRCKIDGHEWEATPDSLLRGSGCPQCANRKRSDNHTKPSEQFMSEIAQLHPNIVAIGTYVNTATKISVRCKLDGYEWEAAPNNLLNGKGCPKCGGNLKKTHETFMTEMAQKHPNIEVLSEYKNAKTKISLRCKIDGYEWEVTPNSLQQKHGCPKCANKKSAKAQRKSHKEFMTEIVEKYPNIEVLGEYVTAQVKIALRCKIDGYEWSATPAHLMNGTGCPKCGGCLKKTHEQFMSEITQEHPNVEVLGDYKNAKTKISVRCKIDGHQWEITPNNLLRGYGCPCCAKYGFNPQKPAIVYIKPFVYNGLDYLVFGITNNYAKRNNDYRSDMSRAGAFLGGDIALYHFDIGHEAKEVEDLIKEATTRTNVDIEGCKTESCPAHELPTILRILGGSKGYLVDTHKVA